MGINLKVCIEISMKFQEEQQKVEVQATVEQKNLVSIGEGIIQIRSHFTYTVARDLNFLYPKDFEWTNFPIWSTSSQRYQSLECRRT